MNLLPLMLVFASSFFMTGCKTIVDPSGEAYAAGDMTLMSAMSDGPCSSLPVHGADVCRFKEGAPIESIWRLIVPMGKGVTGGEVVVYFKDFSRAYSIKGPVVDIPMSDLEAAGKWQKGDTGVATALAKINYTDSDGVNHIIRAEGMAVIIVLSSGYDPLPMDSGLANWGWHCDVNFTTAGRSAMVCK